MERAQAFCCCNENLTCAAVDSNVVYLVRDERAIGFCEMLNSLHAISTDEIDAVAQRADPLSVAPIDSNAFHRNTVKEIVAKSGTIITRHNGLSHCETSLKDLVWSGRHEDALGASYPNGAVEIFCDAVTEVGRITFSILIDNSAEIFIMVVGRIVDCSISIDDGKARSASLVCSAPAHHPCPASSVKHRMVKCRFASYTAYVQGFPLAIFFQDAHNGVALIIAHPKIATAVIIECCDTHKVLWSC